MTDATDLATVTGVNTGGGSWIALQGGGNGNQQFQASDVSTQTPEHENGTTGGCASTTVVEVGAHDPHGATRART